MEVATRREVVREVDRTVVTEPWKLSCAFVRHPPFEVVRGPCQADVVR